MPSASGYDECRDKRVVARRHGGSNHFEPYIHLLSQGRSNPTHDHIAPSWSAFLFWRLGPAAMRRTKAHSHQ